MSNPELQENSVKGSQNCEIFFNQLSQFGVVLPNNLADFLKEGIGKTNDRRLTDPHTLWLEMRQKERVKGSIAVNFDHAGEIIELSIWLPINKGGPYEMVTLVPKSDGSVCGYLEKWSVGNLITSRIIDNTKETGDFLREINNGLKGLGEDQKVSLRIRLTIDRIVEDLDKQTNEGGELLRRHQRRKIKPETEIIELSDKI